MSPVTSGTPAEGREVPSRSTIPVFLGTEIPDRAHRWTRHTILAERTVKRRIGSVGGWVGPGPDQDPAPVASPCFISTKDPSTSPSNPPVFVHGAFYSLPLLPILSVTVTLREIVRVAAPGSGTGDTRVQWGSCGSPTTRWREEGDTGPDRPPTTEGCACETAPSRRGRGSGLLGVFLRRRWQTAETSDKSSRLLLDETPKKG